LTATVIPHSSRFLAIESKFEARWFGHFVSLVAIIHRIREHPV
jgi:hypothetical protein